MDWSDPRKLQEYYVKEFPGIFDRTQIDKCDSTLPPTTITRATTNLSARTPRLLTSTTPTKISKVGRTYQAKSSFERAHLMQALTNRADPRDWTSLATPLNNPKPDSQPTSELDIKYRTTKIALNSSSLV